jgi:hypothetical protein
MQVESVLLENMKQVMLVVRMQEVEIKEGFGAIGAGDGKDAVVNTERGEGIEGVSMGCAKGTSEGASTNEADNEEGGENEAEDKASDAEGEGEGSGEDAGEWVGEVDGPTNEDGGGEASEGNGKAGDAGGGHAGDSMKAFGREIADGKGALMSVEYKYAVAVAMATGEEEADKGDADYKKEEGDVAKCGKQGILPFEIGCEVMGVGRPEAKSGDGKQGGAEAREKKEECGEQARVTSGLPGRIEDGRTRANSECIVFDGLCVMRFSCLYHMLPA